MLPPTYAGLLGWGEADGLQAAALAQVPLSCRPSLASTLLLSEEARAEQRLLHKAIEKVGGAFSFFLTRLATASLSSLLSFTLSPLFCHMCVF